MKIKINKDIVDMCRLFANKRIEGYFDHYSKRGDKIVSEPRNNQFFAFTNVDLNKMEVSILGYCEATNMKYGECRAVNYRKTKKAIYINDIKDNIKDFIF